MKIYIDSREQDTIPQIISYYENHKEEYPNIESIEVKSIVGDGCTADNLIGWERKKLQDFITSSLNKKIKQQLYELRQAYKYPFLIVEGYDGMMDCISKNPQIHPNVIKGITTSAFAHNGVPINYVGPFFITFILETVNKFYDGKRELYESYYYIPQRHTVTKDNFVKYFVKGLPGIGDTVIPNLLQHFNNSVANIVNASIEELMKVEGITKNKAIKIKEVLK